MSLPAISVDHLGKLYQLTHELQRHHSFRDLITDLVTSPLRRLRRMQGHDESVEAFWALRDVSFVVNPGEVVGIVGRNGAGKSTLLKMLSRIVEPTEGKIRLMGRVASLLEVGTGFHPELSGRENIYLNGSIQGMRKTEIDAKFDQIVAFADIERFLDTPVKRYSSGMFVRLAFAVAAHLDPEILIVDEVLAVGDAQFQAKCLGRMKEVSGTAGRTVLFVSHNLAAVSALCSRVILLNKGRMVADGPTDEVLSQYHSSYQRAEEQYRVKTSSITWRGVVNRRSLDDIRLDADIVFSLKFMTGPDAIGDLEFNFELIDELDRCVAHCRSSFLGKPFNVAGGSEFTVRFSMHSPRLAPGCYTMVVDVRAGRDTLCRVEGVDACSISGASPFLPGLLLEPSSGTIIPDFQVDILESV